MIEQVKSVIIIALIFFLSSHLIAQDAVLLEVVEKYKSQDILDHAQWSVYAAYTETGEVIIDYESEQSLAPASGLKVFTSSAALYYLGGDYQYQTRMYYDGDITGDGILNGDLYIVGGGDPTLASGLIDGLPTLDELMKEWITAIKGSGIKKITGSIIADDTFFDNSPIPDNWFWVDMGNYYGAGINGLTIHDNLYHLYFKPGNKVGDKAEVIKTIPEIDGLTFTNYMKTGEKGSGDNGYIYAAPKQFNAVLRGTIPAGVSQFSIKGSIPDPALFAAQYLKKKLHDANISVTGVAKRIEAERAYSDATFITVTKSPPLRDIVFIVNKRSNNLYTETLLRTIAKEEEGIGSNEKGTELVEKFLALHKINTDGLHLYDGCGLSRSNCITAKLMVQLLSMNTTMFYFDDFYNSLAVAGLKTDRGFFKNFGTGTVIENNARIKSGLIDRVRSHSGYVTDQSGRRIAFSMIANNHAGNFRKIDSIHKELMILLANKK